MAVPSLVLVNRRPEIESSVLAILDEDPHNATGELTNIWYPFERTATPWTTQKAVELRTKMKWRRLITTDGFKQACVENKLKYIPTLDWVVVRDCWPHTMYFLSENVSPVRLCDFNIMYDLDRSMYAYKRRYIEMRKNWVREMFPPRRLFKYCEGIE